MKISSRLLLFLAFTLAACTPPPPAPPVATSRPPAAASSVPVPTARVSSSLQALEPSLKGLTIEVWHPWFGTDASLFESLVEEFNSKNLWGFQVAATSQVSYSVLYSSVSAAFPTPDHPDMVIALPEQARSWDDDGFVADLTPYINDPAYGWTSDEVRDIAPVFWLQDAAGERRLALPYQRSARFLLWNKTWASELGLMAPPAGPEDFSRQACAATQVLLNDAADDNNGLGGWVVDTDAMTAFSWMRAFEGGVLEGNDYRFMTPNNIQAFTFLRKLQEDGCAWMPAPDVDPLAAFANRHALFVTAGLEQFQSVTRLFAAANNTDDWVPLAFPGASHDSLVIYGSSLVMLKSTDAAQLAAWLFMDWLLSPENDARQASTTGFFPLRASALQQLSDYSSSHPRWRAAVELIADGDIQPQLGSWRKVRVMLGDGFTQMFRVSLPSGQVPAVLALMESTSRDLSH
jgi:ABC-type glycerol-3-phosphate transport system substrate-binding protein